ncbi:MAG: BamA/TamA family outer membrane protein [Alphaproteobacteria bacterium]|nr:BamA/TamA family outer membrane protein [Alphaproteobacteria bacterium]MCB9791196.1 BamA/TamA family outer membrane protein [Alphaproteobacteria bacterium]
MILRTALCASLSSLLFIPSALAEDEPASEEVESTPAEVEKPANPWDRTGWGWGGVPAIAYNSDDGLGFGVLGSVYRYNGQTAPYKWSATLLLYTTTKGVHAHRVDMDILNAFDKPLRINSRVEFGASKSSNYCGLGPQYVCDRQAAIDAATLEGFVEGDDPITYEGEEYDYSTFVNRYYKIRNIYPNAFINARYMLRDKPHRFEVMGGWWGSYYVPGDFQLRVPYPGSLYAEDFPEGETGFNSNLQVGVMLDNRDNEPAPITGYWIEASVRGASRFWGSDWEYFGFNTTLRGYTPVFTDRLVLADRLVFDGIIGDQPVSAMTRPGGSQIYSMFGGQRAGRGVRNSGVLGRVRAMNQTELRATVLQKELFGKVDFDLTPLAFYDVGYWAYDWSDIGGENSGIVWGTGGGVRLAFNKNFILRLDLGFSPREDWSVQTYIDINNLW